MANFLNTPITNLFNSGFFSKRKMVSTEEIIAGKAKGQLAVDVFQTEDDIIVMAPIAGVDVENIEVIVNDDVLVIRGIRSLDLDIPQNNYYAKECSNNNSKKTGSRSLLLFN